MDRAQIGFAHSQIHGHCTIERQSHRGGHFMCVGGRKDAHFRDRPQRGNVFEALVAAAQLPINHPGSVAGKYDGKPFVANIELDLFEHAHRHEGAQAVHDRSKAPFGQAGGDADHILFRHPGIDVLFAAESAKVVEQRVPMIAGQ